MSIDPLADAASSKTYALAALGFHPSNWRTWEAHPRLPDTSAGTWLAIRATSAARGGSPVLLPRRILAEWAHPRAIARWPPCPLQADPKPWQSVLPPEGMSWSGMLLGEPEHPFRQSERRLERSCRLLRRREPGP